MFTGLGDCLRTWNHRQIRTASAQARSPMATPQNTSPAAPRISPIIGPPSLQSSRCRRATEKPHEPGTRRGKRPGARGGASYQTCCFQVVPGIAEIVALSWVARHELAGDRLPPFAFRHPAFFQMVESIVDI